MSQNSVVESQVNLDVKFFASLREKVGMAELHLRAANLETLLNELEVHLSEAGFEHLLSPNIRMAVNQDLVEGNWREAVLVFSDGDEVAFLPPVTGG
ncbi:MoaD/ThiS family protein [Pseudomonadales bacterium]|nr:MoaD/ThiS family protein [Pseudomonadales bacterium]